MKTILLSLVFCASVFSAVYAPYNTRLIYDDSLRLDGTEVKLSSICWVDRGEAFTVLIECRDDSSAGFASDSAAAMIEVLNILPIEQRSTSKTGKNWHVYASALVDTLGEDRDPLHDSLCIKSMDTASIYVRGVRSGLPSDSIGAVVTAAQGAYKYFPLPIAGCGGIAFRLTGYSNNASRGAGSYWRFRVYEKSSKKVSER